MDTYMCDICDGSGSSYYGYNSWFGYCDSPKCKELATEKLRGIIIEDIEAGNNPMDWCDDSEVDLCI